MAGKKKQEEVKRERIKRGSVSLPFYPWTDKKTGQTYWRWAWKDPDGKWKYGTRADKEDAKEAAEARARTIAKGVLDLDSLSSTQADLVRQFLALNPTSADIENLRQWKNGTSATVSDAVTRWHAFKVAEIPGGVETPHIKSVRQWLEKLAKAFPGQASKITADQLRQHIEAASQSGKSRKDYRDRTTMLWEFARTHDIFKSDEAAKLPKYKVDESDGIDIWTPAELKKLLSECPAEFLPWLVISCFSGLRSEEIAPKPGTKPPLDWKSVKRSQGFIDVPAKLSKVRKRRLVPITPTLEAWLAHINPPASGVVCPRLPSKHATRDLGQLVGKWRKNASRHTYGSWRAAEIKDLPALAIEMGSSFVMIEKHYREAMSEEESEAYRQLVPSEVFRNRINQP